MMENNYISIVFIIEMILIFIFFICIALKIQKFKITKKYNENMEIKNMEIELLKKELEEIEDEEIFGEEG